MLDVGGQDGTEAFEDVGHSDEAREILDGLLVGNVKRMVRISAHTLFRPIQLFSRDPPNIHTTTNYLRID